MTDLKTSEATPKPPVRQPLLGRAWAPVRNLWRSLTSMRTALVLLFLLALAAVPGALLPQRELNEQKTSAYIAAHGTVGRLMDKVQLFDVFGSVWFTAVYVLLFVSLVGCLTPRMAEHYRALRTPPVPTPRNLSRLPRHTTRTVVEDPQTAAATMLRGLRRWRTSSATVTQPDGSTRVEISAEKGYLRELGNLLFHTALLGLLVAIAAGKVYGYEGSRLVIEGDGGFCNTASNYDSFRAGSAVDGTGLAPFCIRADKVTATFHPNREPDNFDTQSSYQDGKDLQTDTWRHYDIRVNSPLRMDGVRVYMLGHGYAPTVTVVFPNGDKRTQTVQFAPQDMATFLSSGAMRFDPPPSLYTTEEQRRTKQIGIEGLLAPTKQLDGALLTSSFPAPKDPALAIDIYQGDTGLDTGKPQNVYSLSRDMINSNRLVRKARVNLDVGQSTRLDDGTEVRFDGVKQFAALQVSHDPAEGWVLICAIAMMVGLLTSLTIKRRRLFARLVPGPDGGTVIEVAGLARTDQAGWNQNFSELVDRLLDATGPGKRTKE
jgi:cytochrome c biogenesis protein